MTTRRSAIELMTVLTMAVLIVSCANPIMPMTPTVGSMPLVLPIPADVRHMAVLYPRGGTPDWSNAYGRLASAAFQLKTFRPNLKIIDRSHMQAIISEQRFQVGGLVSENSAARIGQLWGVDSVLIYQIDGPTLRDQFFARQHHDLPPVTITTKIIRVESGEVIYHNVVTARQEETEGSGWSLSDNVDYHRGSREALDRGIMQTVYHLHDAFD
jgi:hypothetical protein